MSMTLRMFTHTYGSYEYRYMTCGQINTPGDENSGTGSFVECTRLHIAELKDQKPMSRAISIKRRFTSPAFGLF